jgi:hypothetical protein
MAGDQLSSICASARGAPIETVTASSASTTAIGL